MNQAGQKREEGEEVLRLIGISGFSILFLSLFVRLEYLHLSPCHPRTGE